MPDTKPDTKADATLDLRGVICPINFVKAKLKIETMETGQVLEHFLDSGEPIQNVPKSIKEEGHKILEVKKEDGHFRLMVKKG
jgi:tRNA 2-thiouridine synthesizing protein A